MGLEAIRKGRVIKIFSIFGFLLDVFFQFFGIEYDAKGQ
jgi:hypothetical protein